MEFWDTLAHVALQHLKKGDQVYVTGSLKVDLYVKDAVQHKIARVLHFLSCFIDNLSIS
jgi:single-stranded DNA-binding protein